MAGPANTNAVQKPKNFRVAFGKLLRYLKPYKIGMVLVLVFSIASTVFAIVSPKILGTATDTIISGVMSKVMDYDALIKILITLVIIYLISSAFSYLQGVIMIHVSQKVTYTLRKDISEKMDRIPLNYYDTKTHGDILSTITNDIETVNSTLGQSLTQMITSVATVIGIIAMMLSINLIMTVVAVVTLPLSIFFILLIVNLSQKHFKNQQKFLAELNGHVEETYSGFTVVKAFNREKNVTEKFTQINDKLFSSAWKSQFLSGLMMPLMALIGNLSYVFVCIAGGYLAINGTVTIGNIQAFMQYVRQFNQPISQVANILTTLQSTIAAAERVFDFLEETEEENEDDKTDKVDDVKGGLTFENISFGYNPNKIIIHNFSYEVKPGEKIAIVGPTGAGKTTIVKLLMRFYEINSGRILIDGVDISKVKRDELRSYFSMVLQETWLYSDTIRENIRYGDLHATDEDVYKAAKAAYVEHFVHTLPKGYDTIINEEASNISQGQKQLLTIARAILADGRILILDEATSSVDTRTEVLIQDAMANLMKGRTSFIIAHRLSTIKDADVILAMKDGDIVEYGSHEELMKKGAFYANLYNSQFEQ